MVDSADGEKEAVDLVCDHVNTRSDRLDGLLTCIDVQFYESFRTQYTLEQDTRDPEKVPIAKIMRPKVPSRKRINQGRTVLPTERSRRPDSTSVADHAFRTLFCHSL